MKLDIDTPSIEGPLAEQLRASFDESLVNEFFFEHHVNLEPMNYTWHSGGWISLSMTVMYCFKT